MIDQRDAVEGRTVHAKAGSQVRKSRGGRCRGRMFRAFPAHLAQSKSQRSAGNPPMPSGEVKRLFVASPEPNGEEKPFVALDP
jgi:hypothetical protein